MTDRLTVDSSEVRALRRPSGRPHTMSVPKDEDVECRVKMYGREYGSLDLREFSVQDLGFSFRV